MLTMNMIEFDDMFSVQKPNCSIIVSSLNQALSKSAMPSWSADQAQRAHYNRLKLSSTTWLHDDVNVTMGYIDNAEPRPTCKNIHKKRACPALCPIATAHEATSRRRQEFCFLTKIE